MKKRRERRGKGFGCLSFGNWKRAKRESAIERMREIRAKKKKKNHNRKEEQEQKKLSASVKVEKWARIESGGGAGQGGAEAKDRKTGYETI